jgi:polar amino acid transport system substrate-binding protein
MSPFRGALVAALSLLAAPEPLLACGHDGGPVVSLALDTKSNPPRVMGEGTAIDPLRPGVSIEVLCEAAQSAGLSLEFKRVPWARALHLVEHDRVDGIFHASFTPERQAVMVYPTRGGQPDPERAIFHQAYKLYVRNDSPGSWDGANLIGVGDRAVGATRGYAVVAQLRTAGIAVEEEEEPATNFRKLLAGRIAAVAELEGIADLLLATTDLKGQVRKLETPLTRKPYYLTFSRGFHRERTQDAERLWDKIRAINASPALHRIEARYRAGP